MELTRVIELYNVELNSFRTGAYKVDLFGEDLPTTAPVLRQRQQQSGEEGQDEQAAAAAAQAAQAARAKAKAKKLEEEEVAIAEAERVATEQAAKAVMAQKEGASHANA